MILSIIMLTVPERAEQFNKIKNKVLKQINYCNEIHPTLGDVEIIEVNSPKLLDGGESIGKKRNIGMNKSKGKYVIWLDDDDNISPDYVETLLRLAETNADVLTFSSFCKLEGYWMLAKMNLSILEDEQARPGIIERRPYSICAFKKEIVKNIKWIDANINEDVNFINEALKLVKTECNSERILHEYNRETESIANKK